MRCIFVTGNPDTATNPTLSNLIRRLIGDGIEVLLIEPTRSERFKPFESESPNFRSIRFDLTSGRPSSFSPRSIAYYLKRRKIKRLVSEGRQNIVIGVDPQGIADGYSLIKGGDIPLVYLSFEIFFRDEIKEGDPYEAIKRAEVEASRASDLILIQDEVREGLLARENSLQGKDFFHIPVAPSGGGGFDSVDEGPGLIRKSLSIPDDKIIVLYAGSLSYITCVRELFESVSTWPEEFVLVVNMRSKPRAYEAAILEEFKDGPIYFTEGLFKEEDYGRILASADIGLVTYRPTYDSPYSGKNIKDLGLSVGKLSYYMKFGLPSVTLNHTYMETINSRYKAGVNIDDLSGIAEALIHVKENHKGYSEGSRRYFEEVLDFDLYYEPLKAKLETLAG